MIGIYYQLRLQSLSFTINYSATANLPTSQITRARCLFPGNGFITGSITSDRYEVLPFLVQSPWHANPPELGPVLPNQSQSHIATDGQSVSLGVEPHLSLMTRYLLLFDSYVLVFLGRPLWREDGSVFCICCWPSPQRSLSRVRVPWDS
jgi:hypothetical protein